MILLNGRKLVRKFQKKEVKESHFFWYFAISLLFIPAVISLATLIYTGGIRVSEVNYTEKSFFHAFQLIGSVYIYMSYRSRISFGEFISFYSVSNIRALLFLFLLAISDLLLIWYSSAYSGFSGQAFISNGIKLFVVCYQYFYLYFILRYYVLNRRNSD